MQINYQGFKDTAPKSYEFHPHILKQYNRRWFVYGLNATDNINEWSIPLDKRLLNFHILDNKTYSASTTNWDSFFRTMVGVTRNSQQIKRVVLRFHNGREKYFKTKPFIPDFEEFFEEDKQDQVWFETIINRELVQQLLSYGQDLSVLQPETLKQKMSAHATAMQNFYKT